MLPIFAEIWHLLVIHLCITPLLSVTITTLQPHLVSQLMTASAAECRRCKQPSSMINALDEVKC